MDYERNRAFPSETQFSYIEKKRAIRQPYIPIEHWPEKYEAPKLDESAKKLIKKFILERYETTNQRFFNAERLAGRSRITSENVENEEPDAGSELIAYIKHLYMTPPSDQIRRLPYTSTRVFGYATPQNGILSSYQDSYGLTGGKIMMQNLQKMSQMIERRRLRAKLRAYNVGA
ncbi:hypothetical protein TKK_0012779 [Trichogramma kaykai]|uniref:Uncharacterized protein n=1 Tax=Trichogramma kaykai TaxID=54128 RepID=A0ABD2WLX6_9HYME